MLNLYVFYTHINLVYIYLTLKLIESLILFFGSTQTNKIEFKMGKLIYPSFKTYKLIDILRTL